MLVISPILQVLFLSMCPDIVSQFSTMNLSEESISDAVPVDIGEHYTCVINELGDVLTAVNVCPITFCYYVLEF